MFICFDYICIRYCQGTGWGFLSSSCSANSRTNQLTLPLVWRGKLTGRHHLLLHPSWAERGWWHSDVLASVQRAHAQWPAGKQFMISKLWASFPMTSLVWKCLFSLQFSSNSEQLSSSPLFKLGRTWIRPSEVTARMDNQIHTWGSFFF